MALTDKLTAIADAIRAETGGADALTLDQMAEEIITKLAMIEETTAMEEIPVLSGTRAWDRSKWSIYSTIGDTQSWTGISPNYAVTVGEICAFVYTISQKISAGIC